MPRASILLPIKTDSNYCPHTDTSNNDYEKAQIMASFAVPE